MSEQPSSAGAGERRREIPCPEGVSRRWERCPDGDGWWDLWEREWGEGGWALVRTQNRAPLQEDREGDG